MFDRYARVPSIETSYLPDSLFDDVLNRQGGELYVIQNLTYAMIELVHALPVLPSQDFHHRT